jgi:hypothetical protein
MIWPLRTTPGGFNRVLVAIDKFSKWIELKPVTCPKADRVLHILDELVHRYGLTTASSQTWAPTSTITSSWNTAGTAGSTSGMSQSPIHGPTDKSSVPMGWYSTLSRNDYTMLLTLRGASESRNYPMHFGGFVLNLRSQQGNHPTSWSTAPRLSYLPTSCGSRQQ